MNSFGNAHDATRKIFPSELVDKMKPIWGLTDEGEIQGIYVESGLPNVYVMLGMIFACPFSIDIDVLTFCYYRQSCALSFPFQSYWIAYVFFLSRSWI